MTRLPNDLRFIPWADLLLVEPISDRVVLWVYEHPPEAGWTRAAAVDAVVEAGLSPLLYVLSHEAFEQVLDRLVEALGPVVIAPQVEEEAK